MTFIRRRTLDLFLPVLQGIAFVSFSHNTLGLLSPSALYPQRKPLPSGLLFAGSSTFPRTERLFPPLSPFVGTAILSSVGGTSILFLPTASRLRTICPARRSDAGLSLLSLALFPNSRTIHPSNPTTLFVANWTCSSWSVARSTRPASTCPLSSTPVPPFCACS